MATFDDIRSRVAQMTLIDKYWIRKWAEGPVLLLERLRNFVWVRKMKSNREVVLLLDTEIDAELDAGSLSFGRVLDTGPYEKEVSCCKPQNSPTSNGCRGSAFSG